MTWLLKLSNLKSIAERDHCLSFSLEAVLLCRVGSGEMHDCEMSVLSNRLTLKKKKTHDLPAFSRILSGNFLSNVEITLVLQAAVMLFILLAPESTANQYASSVSVVWRTRRFQHVRTTGFSLVSSKLPASIRIAASEVFFCCMTQCCMCVSLGWKANKYVCCVLLPLVRKVQLILQELWAELQCLASKLELTPLWLFSGAFWWL